MCHTTATRDLSFLRFERPVNFRFECRALGKDHNLLKRLRFDAAGLSVSQTHELPHAKREHYQ
jgi:hypothetical protein